MRYVTRTMLAMLFAASAAVAVAADEAKAVQTVAGVLLNLNHFPSDAEKATLKTIVDDKTTPAHARTVAEALIGVKHTVGAADKVKLEALVKDASTPASVKTLASVLVNLNHTPSAAEKEQLKVLAAAK